MQIKINNEISLSAFQASDIPNLIKYLNDPIVVQFTRHIPVNYSQQDAENWIKTTEESTEKHGMIVNWAIRHETHGLIGGIGQMMAPNREKHADEIGYWLAKPFRGKGMMGEVLNIYVPFLVENRALTRVWAIVYAENIASKRSLEKAGFEVEGFMRKYAWKDDRFLDAWLLAKVV